MRASAQLEDRTVQLLLDRFIPDVLPHLHGAQWDQVAGPWSTGDGHECLANLRSIMRAKELKLTEMQRADLATLNRHFGIDRAFLR